MRDRLSPSPAPFAGSCVSFPFCQAKRAQMPPLALPAGFRFGTATVSVPVEFEKPQRAATIAAGKLAGFSLVRIIEARDPGIATNPFSSVQQG